MKSKPRRPAAPFAVLVAVSFASAAAAGVQAQTQAPGLWEHSFTMKSQGGEMERAQAEMEKQLAAMPPEQRQKIEAMMASRGVRMNAQDTSLKFCLTKEQAARPAEPHLTGDCSQSDVKRSGNTMSYRFACTRPQPVSGEGQVSYASDKAYTGQSNVTTQVNGQPQRMSMEMSGKWLSADCGDVKPIGALPAK